MTDRFFSAARAAALLAIAVIGLAPEASSQQWESRCIGPTVPSTESPFVRIESGPNSMCTWRGNDGARYTSDSTATAEIVAELNSATAWLAASGFRAPTLRPHPESGNYALGVVMGDYQGLCFDWYGMKQCLSAQAEPVQAYTLGAGPRDVVILAARRDASGDDALRAALYELMTVTMLSYDGYTIDGEQPAASVNTGIAQAFSDWWMQIQRGTAPPEPAEHRFSQGLMASGAEAGRQTAPFWVYSAGREADGFATLARSVVEAASGAAQAGGDVTAAVHAALEPRFPASNLGDTGLTNAFVQFLWRINAGARDYWMGRSGTSNGAWDTVAPEATLTVPLGRGPVRRTISGHEPLSAVRVPVRVSGMDGNGFGLVIRQSGTSANLVRFFTADEGGGWRSRLDPGMWGEQIAEWEMPVGNVACSTNTSCEFDVYFVNANTTDPAATGTHSPYVLEVEAARQCAFPNGSTGVTYAASVGADPRRQTDVMQMSLEYAKYQNGLRTRVEGEFKMAAGDIAFSRDIEADLVCSGTGHFAVENLKVKGMSEFVGMADMRSMGIRLDVPAGAEVGDRLDPTLQFIDGEQNGAASATGAASMSNLEITDRTSREIEGVGRVSVWEIQGTVSYGMELQPDGLESVLDRDAEVAEGMDETLDPEARAALGTSASTAREALREAMGEFKTEARNVPITLYYSPIYGAVETITGVGDERSTHRLVRVTRPR